MPGIIDLTSNLRYPFNGPPPSRDNEAIPQIGESLINVSNTTPSEFRNVNTTEYPVNRAGDSPLLQPLQRNGKTILESEYRNLQPSRKGNSKSPYIWTPLPKYDDSGPSNSPGRDVIGRSGYINATITDLDRLTQWGFDGTGGVLYLLKQTGLALSAPKTLGNPRRIYNPANTLAQIAVGAISGVHFNKQGLLPFVNNNDKYEYRLREEFNGNESTGRLNRLVALKTAKLNKDGDSISGADALKLDINRNNELVLLQYLGGPNSVLGIGQTRIKRYTNTETWTENLSSKELKKQIVALTYNQLENEVSLTRLSGTGLSAIGNFAQTLKENSTATEGVKKTILGRIANYTDFNRVKTYNAGDPGNSQNLDREAYYQGAPKKRNEGLNGIDNINYQTIYASNDGPITDGSLDDIIKFYFAILDNNDPQYKVYTHFRAYLTKFNDDYSAEWNSYRYMGRGENFYRYQGFDRSISIGFQVHVGSRAELFPTYEKLNYLASVMAPDYSNGGFMRGNLVEITVGDYLNKVPGIIENLEYSFPEDSPWEIARKDDGTPDKNSAELPTLVEVSMNFKPIHKFLPQTVKLDTVFDRALSALDNEEGPLPESQFINMGSDNKGYKPYSE